MRSRIDLGFVDVGNSVPALSAADHRNRLISARTVRTRRPTPISPPIVAGVAGFGDGIAIVAAGFLAALVGAAAFHADAPFVVLAIAFAAFGTINLLRLAGSYRFDKLTIIESALVRLLLVWPATIGVIGLIAVATGALSDPIWDWLSLWGAMGLSGLLAIRLATCGLAIYWRKAGRLRKSVAVIGTGPIAQRLLRRLRDEGEAGVDLVGIFDDGAEAGANLCMGHAVQALDNLLPEVRRGRVDGVIIALPCAEQWRIGEILNRLSGLAVDVQLCADEIGFRLGACRAQRLAGVTLLNLFERPLFDWRWVAKTVEDRVLALVSVLLLSPLFVLVATLIKFDSPGPILFRQNRYGLNNELIEVYKFRTMYHDATDPDCVRQTRRDDPRVTPFGRLLRRTSLDELPQLFNVLQGSMSVVGPRPHATASRADGILFEDATRNYGARHRVKPGITGWAQVNGWRGETQTIEHIQTRVEHDLYYIENWSLAFDLLILLRTLRHGFVGRQVY